MTRPALASIDDLEDRLGETVGSEAQAQARLEDASAIVRAFARKTWLNAEETDLEGVPADIPGVVAQMVERASRNPSGATQEAAGPFSRSFGPDAAQRLYLSAADKLVIRAAVGSTGIGTIATTRGPLETPDVVPCPDVAPEDTAGLPTGVIWPT